MSNPEDDRILRALIDADMPTKWGDIQDILRDLIESSVLAAAHDEIIDDPAKREHYQQKAAEAAVVVRWVIDYLLQTASVTPQQLTDAEREMQPDEEQS